MAGNAGALGGTTGIPSPNAPPIPNLTPQEIEKMRVMATPGSGAGGSATTFNGFNYAVGGPEPQSMTPAPGSPVIGGPAVLPGMDVARGFFEKYATGYTPKEAGLNFWANQVNTLGEAAARQKFLNPVAGSTAGRLESMYADPDYISATQKPALPSQPNMNQMAAQGIRDAMGGTMREMAYTPQQVQAQKVGAMGYNAPQASSQGYNAALAESRGYDAALANAERIAGVGPVTEQTVRAGQLATTGLDPYMNPYESAVVQQSLSDLERARLMQQNQLGAQASAAGAFGGSRQGIAESETNRAFAEQAARTASGLRQAGFTQAQAAAQQDIQSAMQAALANQAANLQAQTTTGQFGMQTQLANQAAANQAALANAAAQNQAGQFGAAAANAAALANAAAQNQAGQFGAQAANVAALQNAQLGAQARQFSAGAQNAATLANQQAALNAALANQSAGLAGSQQRLGAAGQLANIGNLGFGMGQTVQQNLAQQGALQQALQQQVIDAAKGQYTGYTGYPATSLGYMASALGASAQPMSQTTSKQPGLFDYLTLFMG